MKANRSQLANIFGVAKTTIDSWRENGCPVEQSTGKRGQAMQFDTAAVFQWFIRRKAEESGDYTALLEQEKYRKAKRENDLEEKLVAPVSLLTDALLKAGAIIIPILDSLPLVIKRYWPEVTGDHVTEIKRAVAECRNAIADMRIDVDA